jgi:hypothetical protein
MYVTGGQDADGAMVSIIPTMPSMISEWLDMYQVYEKLPSPQLHNYPVVVAREGNNAKLYSLNITKGTSDNRFLGLYEEYGIGEELQCSVTLNEPYEEEPYKVEIRRSPSGDLIRILTPSVTFGASLNHTVVIINTLLGDEEEGRIQLVLYKIVGINEVPIISSSTFIVKEAVWEEKKDEDNNPVLFSP